MNFRRTLHGTSFANLGAAFFAACMSTAYAATTISVDSVIQRWPWNNKVDITYTVNDGQNVVIGRYCRIVFTAIIDGQTYTIDGVHDVGASASAGTHTVTWTAPSGVKCENCTISAAVYSASAPSGDDYMLVDLDTGEITYEGLLATQDASNARYNADTYKTGIMALRKVPAGSHYTSGKTFTTDKDYYIGVFPITQNQKEKIYGSALTTATADGYNTGHRPFSHVSWDSLRLSTTAPTSSVPTVAIAGTGSLLQRLNYKTGNKFAFDLPTEAMWEIAARAGGNGTYYWGSDGTAAVATNYCICKEHPLSKNGANKVAVGKCDPNAWGLYDTAGNVWEWCLDDTSWGSLNSAPDAFTPACNGTASTRRIRGCMFYFSISNAGFKVGDHNGNDQKTKSNQPYGLRVAMIVD